MDARAKDLAAPAAGAPPSSQDDPLVGRTIDGRFLIQSLIARGGMGRVYRAEQSPLGRVCALKIVSGSLAGSDPEYERRFRLEASTAARLTHPNTVTVFDYGKTDDEIFFMAMELLEGRTLHRAMRDEGPFSAERAVRIGQQICRSLSEAHHHHVVHRDLKPANVFLLERTDERDFVKVLDFGLVKPLDDNGDDQLTQTGIFMGSPKYMAPEQIEGGKVDARTDIYSLGVMLYEMLVGRVPFDKGTSVKTLMAHVHEAPAPFAEVAPALMVPSGLEGLVFACLSKNPNDRPSSMDEMLLELRIGDHTVPPRLRLPSMRLPPRKTGSSPPSGPLPSDSASGETDAAPTLAMAPPSGMLAVPDDSSASSLPAVQQAVASSWAPPPTSRRGLWFGLAAIAAGAVIGISGLRAMGEPRVVAQGAAARAALESSEPAVARELPSEPAVARELPSASAEKVASLETSPSPSGSTDVRLADEPAPAASTSWPSASAPEPPTSAPAPAKAPRKKPAAAVVSSEPSAAPPKAAAAAKSRGGKLPSLPPP